METGFIPPMIYYTSPRQDIESFRNGTIRVVTESTRLTNGYIAMNSFGFGGANSHLLLKWNPKRKINNSTPNDDLPRLVTISGRTEESVRSFLKDIANYSLDVEYIRLLHDVYAYNIDNNLWRGYIVLNKMQQCSIKEIQAYRNDKRPIWFIFSGVGSQWFDLGHHLLKFSIFARSMEICDNVLKPYNISVTSIMTIIDEKIDKSPLNTLICIVAIQIGLVDLLTALELIPDNMIGYSIGELGCAYADKCLTIEQTILAAYLIASACVESTVPCGSMATVNLDYETLKNICPADIEIVCRNSQKSNVISGPTECMHVFIKKLQANNTYVQEIFCNNIPYHSHYLASIKDTLLQNLSQLISQPKKRSSKWISTSVPSAEWSTPAAQLCSADYLTNIIMTTVLFEQTIRIIPKTAVTVEIAPTSVLQHILEESLHPQVTNVALTHRTTENPVVIMLQGIGKLYNCGLQPQIAALYPPVEFPVSRGTPMISPSIKWDHSKNWIVPYEIPEYDSTKEILVKIHFDDDDYDYMTGHVINERNLLPAMGYVALVWKTIGKIKGEFYLALPVVFRDLRFVRATHLSTNDSVELTIRFHEGSGKFEICERDTIVMTGEVSVEIDLEQETASIDLLPDNEEEEEHMNTQDIYKELKLRGYQYSGTFRGLLSASITGNKGHVAWASNWITFMDALLQLNIIGKDTNSLYVPTSIRKIVIDPIAHSAKLQNYAQINKTQNTNKLPVRIYKNMNLIVSGGIQIWDMKATSISRRKINADPVIEEHRFVAHQDREKISLHEAIRISTQIALEDHQITKVKAIELVEDADIVSTEELAISAIIEACNNLPLVQASVTLMTSLTRFNASDLPPNVTIADLKKHVDTKVLMVIGFNLLSKRRSLEKLLLFLEEGGYLLSREKHDVTEVTESYRVFSALIDNDNLEQYGLNVILEKRTEKEIIVLLKKRITIKETTVVHINNNNFEWVEKLKLFIDEKETFDQNKRIVVVSEGDFDCGLLGFVNCLRKEPGGELVRGVFIQDETAPKFSLQDPLYAQQLQKDMTVNILRPNKTWGSYRHFCLPAPEPAFVPAAYVCQTDRGNLSTFCWIENDISIDSHCDDLVRVVYSSINFRDVMLATGKLTTLDIEKRFESMSLGLEYVGFDAKGQRVMGVRDNKCIANVVLKSDLQWVIPDTWTFEEAATVPCVYSTSYYALYIKGKMRKGDKVLIHSGSGGVGQSAIHLALHEKCEVFTTVGTAEKRQFIREMFPAIPDDHIGTSRDTSFKEMIMRQTNGRGVDIVLNSLAEEKLIASVRCLARKGRFLEIGKFDFVSNNLLDLSLFGKGISFYGVLLDLILKREKHKHKTELLKLMADGLKNGVIKPIKAKVFQRTEIEKAFRYMTSGKHIGKIILNIQETDKCLVNAPIIAHRRYYCLSDRTYIILGGLGGFGLELTEWLISRGARNVVLTSRSGIKTGYQRLKVSLWRSYGVNITIVKNNNIINPTDCEHLLLSAEKDAPVDAIFNLAVVLKDNILKNQTIESFVESFRAKAWPTLMLDELSRKICPKLRHFVVFSSVSCGRGNAGQTNYGMANSVMERICERRVKDGFPGLAIQWGAIGDVGLVADMQENDKKLVIGGTLQQGILSCLNELDKFLLQNRPIVSSMVVAEKKQRASEFTNIFEIVAAIMNIKDVKKLSQTTSLAELGMDSMMAVEIKQTMERDFNVYLSLQEIRSLTFAKLFDMSDTKTIVKETSEKATSDERTENIFGIVQNEDFISEIFVDLSPKNKESATQVFLIPGIDGCGTIFNHLEMYIKFSATSLHYNTNVISTCNTLSKMVEILEQVILKKLQDKKDFVMVGYSFGAILAIELATRLETVGFKGRIVLIDGAPDHLVLLNKHHIKLFVESAGSNDAEMQVSIFISILKSYKIKISKQEFLMELQKCKNNEERFDIFAKYFLAHTSMLSLANLRTLYTTVYKHTLILQKYDTSAIPRIKLPVTLLKPTNPSVLEADEDYGLHKITSNVTIQYVEGNHVTILRNPKVITAINGEI
ncbi:fatty acid synthase-like isoform X2 [Pseudomyrmex gracilis]|nr:fatty acid synthase-like isoform X2 [Pseudomyrmex gracilis]